MLILMVLLRMIHINIDIYFSRFIKSLDDNNNMKVFNLIFLALLLTMTGCGVKGPIVNDEIHLEQ